MPANDDLLFAEHVVKMGFVARDEVDASLEVQQRMEEMGVRDSLRNVLVNRGVLREADAAVVDRAAGLAPGRDPIPGFALEARLGIGAMGSVYKAWQRGMQRHVAVKILRRDLTSDARQVERLRREAALVGKLDHPNIVRGLDSGESNGLVWFAMEYVDGETLRDRIRRDGTVSPDEAVVIARQLAEALEHAHAQGIVHRDIKPGNVLLTKQGLPRLADYGLAKGQTDDALTQVDATLGTPQYVAPEQARNPRDADIRSDIYSLGATVYTMLSGRPPFEGETLAQTLTKVLYERPAPLREIAPQVPEAFAYVVERMMAKDRRHRYATPTALLADLSALESGRLRVPHGFRGDIAVFEQTRRSRRLWFAGIGVVGGAVALGAAALWWEGEVAARRSEEQAGARLGYARAVPGPEATWDGPLVAEMIRRLEEIRREYPGTPSADAAEADLRRWRHEEREIQRVQELQRRASADEPDYPRLLAEVDARKAELATDSTAAVARRQLVDLAAALRERREVRAGREFRELAELRMATLPEAAASWRRLATALRTRYFGSEPSPLVRSAEEAADRFDRAARLLDRAFEPWDTKAAPPGGSLPRSEFAAAADTLHEVDVAIAGDSELRELLEQLPPPGHWTRADDERRAAAGRALETGAARALESLRQDVDRALERGAFQEALEKVAQYESRALPAQADDVADLRVRAEARRDAEIMKTRDATGAAAKLFLEAFGRLDVAGAEKELAALEASLAAAPVADPAGGRFLSAARRLLDLTESKVWERFRAGVATWVSTPNAGLTDRRDNIVYRGIRDVRTDRTTLVFSYGTGQTWRGSLSDVDLADVLRAGGVPLDEPESALAVAALRITQYRATGYRTPRDLRKGLEELDEMRRRLDAARGVPGSGPVVERLAEMRERRVRETQKEIDDAEAAAESAHARARKLLADGRPDLAADELVALLNGRRLQQTEYVLRRRDELRRELEAAERSRRAGSLAARFPGARLTELPDGAAELVYDFEDPEAVRLVEPDLSEIGSRLLVAVDRPALTDGDAVGAPIRLEHVFTWLEPLPDEDPAAAPLPPLRIDCPFRPAKRIEVSFLFRAERPVFLAVSVCGVTAGVLSVPDGLQGGRGVTLWNATDLDRPDRAFDERTRTTWLERNPDALRKEAETRFFRFEPGRVHRVLFVKDERKAGLWVDGRLRAEEPLRFAPGPLQDRIVLLTFGPADVDDLRIAGTLDPEWARRR